MGRSSLDEAALVVEALGREFEVTGVERLDVGGLDVTVLDLGEISGRRVAVSVLPEATTINIWSSRRAVAAGLLVAGGREPLVIVYSRRGRMTKAAYLYLGYSAYHRGFEVVVVNGGPGEVREVLESLSTIGRVRVSEERLYPVRP
ncbi:MAG: hypothetical protein F7B20_00685 [Aeropyrum sp.]|nr:hypothetical protein [Aeropyrum sp.]MCE4615903.1 hypothetical protein [Aeropyrum sp.]